jgi:putative transcriptional regulator
MPLFQSSRLLRAVICAAALSASAGAERPEPRPARPAPGVFLVAKPQIQDGPFRHSVVLILSHGEDGTLGLIINHATDIPLTKALPNLNAEDAEGYALQFGGPVGLDGLIYLFSADEEPPPDAKKVMANVYFAGDQTLLEDLLKKKEKENRSHLKLYVGHAGWLPDQLEMELARGDWDLMTADLFTLFQREPETIWPTLSKSATVVAERQPSLQFERLRGDARSSTAASSRPTLGTDAFPSRTIWRALSFFP